MPISMFSEAQAGSMVNFEQSFGLSSRPSAEKHSQVKSATNAESV